MRACTLIFALLCLAQAVAQELPQIIPGGIIEQLIDPNKQEYVEFPDGSTAEAVPAVTQDVKELLADEDLEPIQDLVQVIPGGVVEEFVDPHKQWLEFTEGVAAVESGESATQVAEMTPAVSEKAVEIAESEESTTVVQAPMQKSDDSEDPLPSTRSAAKSVCCTPYKKWYFELKPGYLFFTEKSMRQFFGDGGFTGRAEVGCKIWGPLMVWVDGGYFQKTGKAIGGTEDLEIKLATITLGLKAIYYFNSYVAAYVGAAPRLFMMMMHNDSPFVRGDDNEIGIGGGFDGGFWFFPIPRWPNFFFDLFADYSWKKMKVDEDEISSDDFDVDVSGVTAGLGIGVKF